jgi:hypothetical protein
MALNPFVRRLGLQQLEQRHQQRAPAQSDMATRENEPALVSHVRKAWGVNKLYKQRVDLRLLGCLRARRGVYSAAEISQRQTAGGVNLIWYDLTETKCRAASAWVRDIVMPATERAWGLDPTPIPDLPMPIKEGVVRKALSQAEEVMAQAAEAGGGVMPQDEFRDMVAEFGEKLRSEAEQTYKKAAARRARRMETQIADRMAQGNWNEAMDAFVEDFCTYPAAILKGPIYQRHKRLSWGDGWKPQVNDDAVQSWEAVSPFDVYPAPAATSPQEGDFIERIRFFRKELYALKGLPGYRDDQIDLALRDYTKGYLDGWLWTEAERQRLTSESMYMWISPPGVIDALNYYGSVPGWMLLSWGVEGVDPEDPMREYEVNLLLVGQYLVFAALNPNPLGERPFRRACYDEIPGAFWGRSIPELCETSQKFCNLAGSAMADNVVMASGPMVWIHADRLADGEQTLEIIPWKVWQLKDAGMGSGTNPGIGFFQADDNTTNLAKVLDFWELKADDATGIPRYSYGNDQVAGAAGTATGLSMLMNSAAKGLRRAIGSIDLNVIGPTVGDTFVNEMLYNPDESIKGDCIPVPRGANAILIKDMAQQRRMEFLQLTANPIDMAIIGNRGRASLLRETASAMELPDDVVPDEEKLTAMEEAQAQQQEAMKQEALGMAQANTELEMARDEQKAALQAEGDARKQFTSLMGDVMRTQLQKAQGGGEEGEEGDEATGGKKPAAKGAKPKRKRSIKFEEDAKGKMVGATIEED